MKRASVLLLGLVAKLCSDDQLHISALNVHECSLLLSSKVIFVANLASSPCIDDACIVR